MIRFKNATWRPFGEGTAHPTKQIATYVLDVDTNMKGEFGAVAPQLTEGLQTAFSEKRDTFKILERHHLDQLVKANQLEKDSQANSHGEPASEQFVRQVRADGVIRGELIDGSVVCGLAGSSTIS
jgi:hypothetical protein